MNRYPPHFSHARSRGFVLVTSLIFLVIITMLTLSAMNSSTLQERMASNQREKSRARQAADAALREGETILRSPAFDTLPAFYDCAPTGGGDGAGTGSALRVCIENSMLPSSDGGARPAADAFLAETIWGNSAVAIDTDSGFDVGDRPVKFFVEAMQYQFNGADLDPDRAAVGDGGVYYRITARAHGQNPAAIAVTQSIYEKNY